MTASGADPQRVREARLANIRQQLLAPATAIVGYGELLRETTAQRGFDGMLSDLERVLEAARALQGMVDHLLSADSARHIVHSEEIEEVQQRLRHDLRTPINAIKGYAEMLLEDLDMFGGGELKPDFERLLSQTNQMLAQLNRIVTFGSGEDTDHDGSEAADADASMAASLLQSMRPLDASVPGPEETGRILVVDDIDANRELLSRRLAHDGHRVATAEDGRKALELLNREAFDLVLLDLMMPEMNGFEVLARMKADPELKALPVIMVSAFDETDSVIRCVEAGADDYLPKPVNPTLLRARIKAGLEKKQWQDAEKQQKKFIRQAFSRYISPAVVDQLLANPEKLSLGGERIEITCVFTDLAGFTSLMEGADPARVLPVLNHYLDGMCRIVRDHNGTIDKIVGDALHVFFNAPLPQPDHAERAVAAAMAMDAYAREFVTTDSARAVKFGGTRIGVHTGMAVVGNFGGESFFDYTAHGDSVNTAARLESVNSHLGTSVCVSSETAGRCLSILFRPIGELTLKGKSRPVETFEPVSDARPDIAAPGDYAAAYEKMRSGSPDARAAFEDLLRRYPEDVLVRLHARRLAGGEAGAGIVLAKK